MGLLRKTASVSTLGLIRWRSTTERRLHHQRTVIREAQRANRAQERLQGKLVAAQVDLLRIECDVLRAQVTPDC